MQQRPPRYCARPDHTAQTAFRAHRSRKPAPGPAESAGAERPASLAGTSLRITVDRLAELLAEFETATGAARELLETATDPETVAAELAAVRAEALKTVADAEIALATEKQADRRGCRHRDGGTAARRRPDRRDHRPADGRDRQTARRDHRTTPRRGTGDRRRPRARADEALAHLDAARAEARDAIDRAARADTTRQTAETIRDDALAKLASLNEQSSRAAAETPPARPAR